MVHNTFTNSLTGIKKLFFALATSALVFATLVPSVQAIGISPPIIEVKDMLRNSTQSFHVAILLQDPVVEDTYFDVIPRGEYQHYIKGENELVIPKGKTSAVYNFTIEPIDAAVGTYDLMLTFVEKSVEAADTSESSSGATTAVAVKRGATLILSVGISGEERVSYQIQRASFNDTEVGLPLNGIYTIYNNGNVEWKPTRIEVVLTDQGDEENVDTYTVESEDIGVISPGETIDSRMTLAHNLIEGRYVGALTFYDGDTEVGKLTTGPFSVFPKGTLDQSAELTEVYTTKDSYQVGESVVLKAVLRNTGDVTIEGQVETVIYKDGQMQNLEVSRTLQADRGQEIEFQQFLALNEPGTYTLEVSATYGNRKTPSQEIEVVITPGTLNESNAAIVSLVVIGLLIVGIILFLIFWHRRKKKEEEKVGMQPTPTVPGVSAAVTPVAEQASPTAVAAQAVPPSESPTEPVVSTAPQPIVTPQPVEIAPEIHPTSAGVAPSAPVTEQKEVVAPEIQNMQQNAAPEVVSPTPSVDAPVATEDVVPESETVPTPVAPVVEAPEERNDAVQGVAPTPFSSPEPMREEVVPPPVLHVDATTDEMGGAPTPPAVEPQDDQESSESDTPRYGHTEQ